MDCKICDFKTENLKLFSNHLNSIHKISSENYSIKYLYNDCRPKCLTCNSDTRYVSFSFKEYCKEHQNIKFSLSGKIGGQNKTQWNKGKSKETELRLWRAV